jgi:hypothetical protein
MDPKPHEAAKHEHGHAPRNPCDDDGRDPEPKPIVPDPGGAAQLIPPSRGGDGDD